VAAGAAHGIDEELPHFQGQLFHLGQGEVMYLLGGGDGIEKRVPAHALRSDK